MSKHRILIDAHSIIADIKRANIDNLKDIGITLNNVCEKALECIINTRGELNPDTAHLHYNLYEFERSFEVAVRSESFNINQGNATARYNTLKTMYIFAITAYYKELIRVLPRLVNLKQFDRPSYYVIINEHLITGSDDTMLIDFTIDYLPF